VIKENPARVQTQMYVALQIAAALSILSEPFLPFTSGKLKNMLNMNRQTAAVTNYGIVDETLSMNDARINQEDVLSWNDVSVKSDLLPAGSTIGQAELLFAKIEDEAIQKQVEKLEATKIANTAENKKAEPQKDLITYEDFSKMDIRTGTILEAEKMPKANKLLVLKVDTGIDVRTIVSGIAESFTPEEVVGKKVTVLVNLAPRNLRGVESQGMILMTQNEQGKLVFVNPDTGGVGNGEVIS
jgi:methionyl-tRNA synthetase